jgi:hypothetical protein
MSCATEATAEPARALDTETLVCAAMSDHKCVRCTSVPRHSLKASTRRRVDSPTSCASLPPSLYDAKGMSSSKV